VLAASLIFPDIAASMDTLGSQPYTVAPTQWIVRSEWPKSGQSEGWRPFLLPTWVGYSRLMGADEEGTLDRLRSIRVGLTDPKIVEHRGRIVKTTGDGLLVEFGSVIDALRCAAEWQRDMACAWDSQAS
jgi:hypothetical protein